MLPALPERVPGRALWAVLAAGALAWLLGEQGVRLGPWLCPLWDWTYLPWAALVAFVLAPPAASRRRSWPLVVALLLTAWPVDAWRREARRAEFPLGADVWPLGGGDDAPERTVGLRSLRLPRRGVMRQLFGRGEDFRLEAHGFLFVPRAGAHRFTLEADDAARLRIDGREVVAAPGSATVVLDAGPHALTLDYRQERGAASLLLTWDRPGVLELLPLEHHVADAPDVVTPRQLLRKRVQAAAALSLAFLWCAGAGALVVRAGEAKARWWRGALRPRVRRARAALRADPHVAPAALVAGTTLVLLALVESWGRPLTPDGRHFQPYTSEYLMQTVSAADLRDEPLRSLFYLHIQPPMLDGVRAVLAQLHRGADDVGLMDGVDAGLYVAWALASAALGGLVCLWLCRLAGPRAALVSSLVFLLHPATLFYATLLDGTLLTALGVAWLGYELWRVRGGAPLRRLALATLFLFFTRSVFQWPFLVAVAAALALLRVAPRRLLAFAAGVGLVMGAYMAKQHALFGITFTSSFAADNFCKGLHEYCPGKTPVPVPELPDPSEARVLSRTAKLDGEYNYNQLAFLRRSFAQMAEYRQLLRTRTAAQNAEALRRNLAFWLRPSSRYTGHVLVDRLPWRRPFDAAFSGAALVALLALAAGVWLARSDRVSLRAALAFLLPVGYVFAVSVLFEGGENMRFKFFLEPVLFVFLAAQAAALPAVLQRLRRAGGRRA